MNTYGARLRMHHGQAKVMFEGLHQHLFMLHVCGH
jgi:hypothetical protein